MAVWAWLLCMASWFVLPVSAQEETGLPDSANKIMAVCLEAMGNENYAVRLRAEFRLVGLLSHYPGILVTVEGQSRIQAILVDTNVFRRAAFASVLGRIEGKGKLFVDLLLALLKDPAPQVRIEAVHSLGRLKISDEAIARVVPHLIFAFHDTDAAVRGEVTSTLALLPKAAIPELTKALSDQDSSIRAHALLALYKMGMAAYDALPFLIIAMDDPEPKVRGNAAAILGNLNLMALPAVSVLIRHLADHEPSVRINVAWALSRIYPMAQEAVYSALRDAEQKETDPEVKAVLSAILKTRVRPPDTRKDHGQ